MPNQATKGDIARLDANHAEMKAYLKALTGLAVALLLLTLAPYFS